MTCVEERSNGAYMLLKGTECMSHVHKDTTLSGSLNGAANECLTQTSSPIYYKVTEYKHYKQIHTCKV